jgi:hypothetical protein
MPWTFVRVARHPGTIRVTSCDRLTGNSEPKMETLVEARVTAIAKAAAVSRPTARRIVRLF